MNAGEVCVFSKEKVTNGRQAGLWPSVCSGQILSSPGLSQHHKEVPSEGPQACLQVCLLGERGRGTT